MNEQAIVCNLNVFNEEERGRHFDLIGQWRELVEESVELTSGYAFRFAPTSDLLMGLAEFVSRERLCCPFFHFEIAVEAGGGPIWLRLLGGDEVKRCVRGSLVEK